jgi:hypothetical protein
MNLDEQESVTLYVVVRPHSDSKRQDIEERLLRISLSLDDTIWMLKIRVFAMLRCDPLYFPLHMSAHAAASVSAKPGPPLDDAVLLKQSRCACIQVYVRAATAKHKSLASTLR